MSEQYNNSNMILKKKKESLVGLSQTSNECLERYFDDLGGMTPPPDLYDKIMSQVEKPLLENVLRYVRGNQVRAATILGINRNTLRKKISVLNVDMDLIMERKVIRR
ncbi:MAG: DNA-binding protein Fis [Alphaproteobacteria bacterium]|jgi:DNA-binding protein Fis